MDLKPENGMGMRGIAGLVLLVGLSMFACSDEQDVRLLEPTVRSEAAIAAGCDLREAKSDARSFFDPGSDIRKEALDSVGQMERHCTAGDVQALDLAAWSVVGLVEVAVEARSGSENEAHASIGDALVNRMLACTLAGGSCAEGLTVGIEFTGPLGPLGLFAVVGDDSRPVVARDVLGFTDWNESPGSNAVLWALVADDSWSELVTGTTGGTVLFYGSPGSLSVHEASFGIPGYEISVFPTKSTTTSISLVACLEEKVNSHPPGGLEGEFAPRIQRETTILESSGTEACEGLLAEHGAQTVQQAALWGGLARFLPRPLLALFTDGSVGGVAGDLSNFSRFAPVAADVRAMLVLAEAPTDSDGEREVVGEAFEVKVRAETGKGTPLEAVEVILSIAGNSGQGATFGDGSTELNGRTAEEDGTATFAPMLLQPGGYILCARGTLDDFSVAEVCTELFHVANDTGI